MKPEQSSWIIPPVEGQLLQDLSIALGLPELLLQCLQNRGIKDPHSITEFLNPRLKSLLDPFLLPGMQQGVDRLIRARTANERLVVFGDYDADGITAAAIISQFLCDFSWKSSVYLPHRMEKGYGLTGEAVDHCLELHAPHLILAVDCGTTSIEVVDHLQQKNIDVIILDHHQPESELPRSCALINPQVTPSECPGFIHLCSAGLAFKLVHALLINLRKMGEPTALNYDLKPLLDLVSVGSIADMVPLLGENRALVTAGLARLSHAPRPGLFALKAISGLEENVVASDVAFKLAPRLNAAGRLEDATQAFELMIAKSPEAAAPLAQALNDHNQARQALERSIAQEAAAHVAAEFDPERDLAVVAGNAQWHVGVVGIVASRIQRQYHRPTLIFGGDGDVWRGSGRSIEGIDLADLLRSCSDLLVKHGGHAMAAGLTIQPSLLAEFKARLNKLLRENTNPVVFIRKLRLDAEVQLSKLTIPLLQQLGKLAPHGQGNPVPSFCSSRLQLAAPPQRFGKTNTHLRLSITDGKCKVMMIHWNASPNFCPPSPLFDLAYTAEIDSFREPKVVLKFLDWKKSLGSS